MVKSTRYEASYEQNCNLDSACGHACRVRRSGLCRNIRPSWSERGGSYASARGYNATEPDAGTRSDAGYGCNGRADGTDSGTRADYRADYRAHDRTHDRTDHGADGGPNGGADIVAFSKPKPNSIPNAFAIPNANADPAAKGRAAR